ncbi:translation initiation factor IF-2 N-terminal domain-containing protein, partial [Psychrobacter sp. 1U2]
MADKTVKELAEMVGKTVGAVQQQLQDAGLPARGEDDSVTELEQEKLVTYLKQSHGQQEKRRISL